jgi:hypothetical protein
MPPKAIKLLERMRRSKANWKRKDIKALYLGFGFDIRPGSNHDIVTHPKYRLLRTTLPRHNKVATYIVRQAISIVDRLLELEKAGEDDE